MTHFEYTITTHSADAFKRLIYFCSEDGECSVHQIPDNQVRLLETLLNDRGKEGWDLIQLSFGKDGVLGFWKREINPAP